MTQDESEGRDEFHFIQLVMTFQAAAMQQLGKLQNPLTKKIERNLDQAQFSIDMLEMIQNKTKNNLSENEQKFLEHALYELRMNYVDEVKKDEEKKEEKKTAQKDETKDQSDLSNSKGKKTEQKQKEKDPAEKEQDRDENQTESGTSKEEGD